METFPFPGGSSIYYCSTERIGQGRQEKKGCRHFHCCAIDGVFTAGEDGQVHFAEAGALTPEDLAAVQQQVRARVLR
jgi:hypothetical protein